MLWTYYVEDLIDCYRAIGTERCGGDFEWDLILITFNGSKLNGR